MMSTSDSLRESYSEKVYNQHSVKIETDIKLYATLLKHQVTCVCHTSVHHKPYENFHGLFPRTR